MNPGTFSSGLLTGLREGVEAALIVSIVIAYVVRTGNGRHLGKIWLGAGAAAAVSLVLGVVLFITVHEFPQPYEMAFEGAAMLLAATIVTWMLFWMRRQSATVKGELQSAVDRILNEGSVWGLALLAFTAVVREGIETSLFIVGQATSAQADAPGLLVGALVGLALATAIGYGFYRGSRRLNLTVFFRWTGVALIFIAAGLLSHAVHEFIDVADLAGVAIIGAERAFDLSGLLPHEAIDGAPGGVILIVGQFLRALVGYTSRPELLTLGVYVVYLFAVLAIYLRPIRPGRQKAATAAIQH